MRTITNHQATEADTGITIRVIDEPGPGGANHHYVIDTPGAQPVELFFQNGPVAEQGVNGITQETLIAIAIDRLRSFQSGPFACDANQYALSYLDSALQWLHRRTRERMARGVEGRNVT